MERSENWKQGEPHRRHFLKEWNSWLPTAEHSTAFEPHAVMGVIEIKSSQLHRRAHDIHRNAPQNISTERLSQRGEGQIGR